MEAKTNVVENGGQRFLGGRWPLTVKYGKNALPEGPDSAAAWNLMIEDEMRYLVGEGKALFCVVVLQVQEDDSAACFGHEAAVKTPIRSDLVVDAAGSQPTSDSLSREARHGLN
jgi:hypothetical protein